MLTSVVLASLSSARDKAQDAKVLIEMRQIQTAMELYYNDNGRYLGEDVYAGINQPFCIGTSDCVLAGYEPGVTLEHTSIIPPFTYKPSSTLTVGSGSNHTKGFTYTFPDNGTAPSISFPLNKGGPSSQKAGVWVTENSGS